MQKRLKLWNPEENWSYKPFVRKWRKRAPMFWIMIPELAGTVALLVLFAIAQPDLFRTQLWEVGYVWGFNSDPNIVVYAKANHKPHPDVPFVWSLNLTNYNVAISVLSLFVLVAKLVGFIMRVWVPLMGVFFSLAMAVMYAVSVYGQMGPDYYDPDHPSPIAWYIRYGCGPAAGFPNDAVGSCHMAQGTYAVTVYQLFLYLLCLAYAVYNMIPTAEEKEEIKTKKAMKADDASSDRMTPVDKVMFEMVPPHLSKYPMQQQQQQQYQPQHGLFTPRTQAFQTLDRKLPLRSD